MDKIIHRRPQADGLLLDGALVLDEKQLTNREFIKMQVVANRLVHIHHGHHKSIVSA
ncbi:hypothetical protein D3C83_286750 [compost metagenome]